ncbi:hypothetical protein H9P43_004379 [Blastocladiella emersonii ATCC 22665]|nr:hypothetical protein H9P43_004379 [Blastocladiella emersonii ATCC 22665]
MDSTSPARRSASPVTAPASTADGAAPFARPTTLRTVLDLLVEVLASPAQSPAPLAAALRQLADTVSEFATLQAFQNAFERMCADHLARLPPVSHDADTLVAFWRHGLRLIAQQYHRLDPDHRVAPADRDCEVDRPWTRTVVLMHKTETRQTPHVYSSISRGVGTAHLKGKLPHNTHLMTIMHTTGTTPAPPLGRLALSAASRSRKRSATAASAMVTSRRWLRSAKINAMDFLDHGPFASFAPVRDSSNAAIASSDSLNTLVLCAQRLRNARDAMAVCYVGPDATTTESTEAVTDHAPKSTAALNEDPENFDAILAAIAADLTALADLQARRAGVLGDPTIAAAVAAASHLVSSDHPETDLEIDPATPSPRELALAHAIESTLAHLVANAPTAVATPSAAILASLRALVTAPRPAGAVRGTLPDPNAIAAAKQAEAAKAAALARAAAAKIANPPVAAQPQVAHQQMQMQQRPIANPVRVPSQSQPASQQQQQRAQPVAQPQQQLTQQQLQYQQQQQQLQYQQQQQQHALQMQQLQAAAAAQQQAQAQQRGPLSPNPAAGGAVQYQQQQPAQGPPPQQIAQQQQYAAQQQQHQQPLQSPVVAQHPQQINPAYRAAPGTTSALPLQQPMPVATQQQQQQIQPVAAAGPGPMLAGMQVVPVPGPAQQQQIMPPTTAGAPVAMYPAQQPQSQQQQVGYAQPQPAAVAPGPTAAPGQQQQQQYPQAR